MCIVVHVLVAGVLYSGCIDEAKAQCNGIFGTNQVCGSVAGGVPGPNNSTSFPSGPLTIGSTVINGGTSNALLYNNAGVLGNTTALPNGTTATTQIVGDNTTNVATDAFVIANLPTACNTLGAFLVGTGSGSQCSTTSGSVATLNGGPFTVNAAASTLGLATLSASSACDSNTTASTLIHICDGSAGTPHTAQTPSVGISRVDAATGPTTNISAALWVNNVSTSVSAGPSNGIYSKTIQTGVGVGDTVALLGVAVYSGSATGGHGAFGIYLQGDKTVNGTGAFLMQGSIDNATGSDDSWSGTFSTITSAGFDTVCGGGNAVVGVAGTNRCASAYSIRAAGASTKFDVGIGFYTASVLTSSIEDDSASVNVFKITGAHTNIIDANSGSASSFFLRGPSATFTVDGSGNTAVNGTLTNTITQNAVTAPNVINSSTGTGAAAGYILSNSANSAIVALTSTGWTSAPSIIGPNRLALRGVGTSAIVIESNNASPIIFGVSDAEVARFTSTGGLTLVVGTADPGAGNISSAATVNSNLTGLMTNLSTGTAAYAGWSVQNSANNGIMALTSTGWTSSPAIIGPNRLAIRGIGVAALVIELNNSNPIIFGISDLETARFTPNGGLAVGVTADPGSGVILANTALQSVLVKGGTAAGSTLTVESTSGAGTSDSTIFQTGSQVVAGFINTSQQWTIGPNVSPVAGPTFIVNQNTLQVPTGGLSGSVVAQFGAPVNTLSRIELIGAGNSGATGFFVINFLGSRGTFSAPTATQANDLLGAFGAGGRGASQWNNATAAIIFNATETFTNSTAGTNIVFQTTASGSTSATTSVTVQSSGGLSVGTATDPGTGSLQLNAQFFMPNITQTSAAQTGTFCWTTGTGKATVDTTLACLSSSARWKHHIRPWVGNALAILPNLQPSLYEWDSPIGPNQEGDQLGMIAEQVWAVDHRLAGLGSDGLPRAWRQDAMIAFLVQVAQELKANNDNLRADLAQLRKASNQ